MKRSAYFIFVASLLFLTACANQFETQIQKAVEDNQKATSLKEWSMSESHPEVLFNKWREELAQDPQKGDEIADSVCRGLEQLDNMHLTVFEEELDNAENSKIVQGCLEHIRNRLSHYYSLQRSQLTVAVNAFQQKSSGNNFKFPVNIQKRDLSQGYKAVTGDVAKKEVILTFDDGPSGQYTPSILRSLEEVNAKAIFFALGKNVRANPTVLRDVADKGHAIGSHSVTHSCLGNSAACRRSNGRNLTTAEAAAEIRGGHQAIMDVVGWVDPFFRFPYGESSPALREYLKTNSVGEFFWAIDSEDWKAQSNAEMIRKTLEQVDSRGRGILLFHDIQRKTAESLPQILRELYNRGYSIVLLQAADDNARYNSKLVKKPLP